MADSLLVIELKLSLIDQALVFGFFELQVVACCNVVVLIGVDALQNMVSLKTKLGQFIEDERIDRYL